MECCLSAATAIDYTPYIINETRMSTLQSEYINVKTIFKKKPRIHLFITPFSLHIILLFLPYTD